MQFSADFIADLCYNKRKIYNRLEVKSMTKTEKELQEKLTKANEKIEILEAEVENFRLLIANMNRRMFGKSSEKTEDPNQLDLFGDSSFTDAETTAEKNDDVQVLAHKRKKKVGHKATLIADLPKEEILCDLPEEERICDCCGKPMSECGKRLIRSEVKFIPATLKVLVYKQAAYECTDCKKNGIKNQIKTGQAPKAAITHSLAGPSVLAEVIHLKSEQHLPLYRQEKEWTRYGLSVCRRTLANWVIGAGKWLERIYDVLHQELCKEEVIHADETVCQILHRSDGKSATSDARLWLFCTADCCEHQIVLYKASLTRARSVVEKFLEGFSGYVHCDGYLAYRNLPNITPCACWAHLKRKFLEAGNGPEAKRGVTMCANLFHLEKSLKGLPPEERLAQRQKLITPLLDEFWQWTEQTFMNGALKKAVQYALNLKKDLMQFMHDGRVMMSNNKAELNIRPTTVGRKNYYFSTSETGAKANAISYSIVETAKANKLNVTKYLTLLFEQLPQVVENMDAAIQKLLPWSPDVQELCGIQNK
jgi:transposase